LRVEKRTILLQIGLLFNHIFRGILIEEGRAIKALKLTIKHQNFGFTDKNIAQRASMRLKDFYTMDWLAAQRL
jgi:hypothetical protein